MHIDISPWQKVLCSGRKEMGFYGLAGRNQREERA
jgi:hypothetical protein